MNIEAKALPSEKKLSAMRETPKSGGNHYTSLTTEPQ
jgi:hypothetical protein